MQEGLSDGSSVYSILQPLNVRRIFFHSSSNLRQATKVAHARVLGALHLECPLITKHESAGKQHRRPCFHTGCCAAHGITNCLHVFAESNKSSSLFGVWHMQFGVGYMQSVPGSAI